MWHRGQAKTTEREDDTDKDGPQDKEKEREAKKERSRNTERLWTAAMTLASKANSGEEIVEEWKNGFLGMRGCQRWLCLDNTGDEEAARESLAAEKLWVGGQDGETLVLKGI